MRRQNIVGSTVRDTTVTFTRNLKEALTYVHQPKGNGLPHKDFERDRDVTQDLVLIEVRPGVPASTSGAWAGARPYSVTKGNELWRAHYQGHWEDTGKVPRAPGGDTLTPHRA